VKVVSLSAVRKTRAKAAEKAQATANATRFGASKAQKTLEKTKAEKAARDLDGHKRE
jgi:Domain of unknown function (DUF4169)